MIEAANVLGYKFHVDYNTHTLSFYIPEDNRFSGYRYRPEVNLKSFSASYDATELATIMHAIGGTDAKEQNIPLVPALPNAFKTWFNQNNPLSVSVKGLATPLQIDWKSENYRFWFGQYKDQNDNQILPYTALLDQIIAAETGCTIENYVVKEAQYTIIEQGSEIKQTSPYKYFTGVVLNSAFSDKEEDRRARAIEIVQAEVDECRDFVRIADKVPYLGQFLCDFSFFTQNNLMNQETHAKILQLLDNMRIYNTQLKIDTPPYYNILYTIAKKHAQMEVLAEQYISEWLIIENKLQENPNAALDANYGELQRICNSLTSLFSQDYFN